MREHLRPVVSTVATVAAMALLLVGPDVSADEGTDPQVPVRMHGR
ncbi:MAG TPA: hypothetical protein VFJ14_14100 [Nocardioidaceae bacterium]|nr:hypothetical protein [Nocardioidaceae bacterium]